MRFVFLIPDHDPQRRWELAARWAYEHRLSFVGEWIRLRRMRTSVVFGGILNIMRHAAVARDAGAEAVLATIRGLDTYGELAPVSLPFIRWADRRADDVCLVPDFVSGLVDEVRGPVIVYLQSPLFLARNFDYLDPRVTLWTDSEFMLAECRKAYPGKEITIVPNVVDRAAFPFIPQAEREQGLVFAFPRKGPEFIAATRAAYEGAGGRFWRFELIDGLGFRELARQFRRPQVFLASAPIEGCALPPQESMAAGVVVVGRTAAGANFCMEHRQTAMVAETPEEAARCLVELEDAALREHIAAAAFEYIRAYFPEGQPSALWRSRMSAAVNRPRTEAVPA